MSDVATLVSPSDDSWRELAMLERYLLRCDEQGGAMVFRIDLDFDGLLDYDRFRAAAESVLQLHPLLNSYVDENETWRACSRGLRLTCEHVPTLPDAALRPMESIDIHSEAGLAIHLVLAKNNTSRVSFSFHHVSVDGQGGAKYARDLFAFYFGQERESKSPPRIDWQRLSARAIYEPPRDQPPLAAWEKIRNTWVTVRGKNIRFPTRSLPQPDSPLPDNRDSALNATSWLSDSESAECRQAIRTQGLTLNDVAVAASMIAIASLSQESQHHQISVMNPVDLRTWGDRRLSAANRFGLAYVRRQLREVTDRTKLLESVVEQLTYVRQRGVAAELIKGVELAERVPGLLSAIERSERFIATANVSCMSNLSASRRVGMKRQGGLWSSGEITFRQLSALGPLPPGVPLSLAVCDGGDVISLGVRGRKNCFEQSQIEQMSQTWRDALATLTKQICT